MSESGKISYKLTFLPDTYNRIVRGFNWRRGNFSFSENQTHRSWNKIEARKSKFKCKDQFLFAKFKKCNGNNYKNKHNKRRHFNSPNQRNGNMKCKKSDT